MVRRVPIVAAALVLLSVVLAAALFRATGDASAPKTQKSEPKTHESKPPKTYQQLVAANYRVLRPGQSRRLLGFAEAFHGCMVAHIPLGEPKALPTKIRMALPTGVAPSSVLTLAARCGAKLGDPPPRSSLLIRKHVIVLFLPKRCLLDPKIVGAAS